MLLVYTGNGKGKTSASLGQCVRAVGGGLSVIFVQFMKKDHVAGEQKVLSTLPGVRWYAGGKGFFRKESQRDDHRAAAEETYLWTLDQLEKPEPCHMLIMDECLYALGAGLLTREEVQRVIDLTAARGIHLVLSGRGLPDWLKEQAQLVTEMREIKHPIHQGISAAKGIEY